MIDADATRAIYDHDLTVAKHYVRNPGGDEIAFYFRRRRDGAAVLEVCVFPVDGQSAGVALTGSRAFEFCSIARAYCESARLAIDPGHMPVDPLRRPMSWWAALGNAVSLGWMVLRERKAVGWIIMDLAKARDEAICARGGLGDFAPSNAPDATQHPPRRAGREPLRPSAAGSTAQRSP